MPEPNLYLLFIRPLNRLGIRYIVGGSVAATYYGESRTTNDIDVVVFLDDNDLQRLTEAFPAPEFYVPPPEVLYSEIRREQRGHFNIIHNDTVFKADMYPVGRDELNAWGFRFKRTVQYDGESVVFAPPEYVIVRKLEYYREGGSDKHLRDIRSMLAISGDQLDRPSLADWIKRRGLETEWRLASAESDT
jgi:hypothetical protein